MPRASKDAGDPPWSPAQARGLRWRRLRAQGLLGPFASVEEALEHAGGLSGAVPSCLLALAARVRGFRPEMLDEAVARKRVLRVPAMRGSIYLLPAARAGDGLALAGAERVRAGLRQAGIDDARYDAFARGVAKALAGGERRTAAELRERLEGTARSWPGPLLTVALRALSHEGRIVRAGTRGGPTSQMFEYAAMESWLGKPLDVPPRQKALARLAPWYLGAHAPATAHDFAWWAGVDPGEAEEAFATAKARPLPGQDKDCEGPAGPHYATEGAAADLAKAPRAWRSVALLPHWDAWLMAHADRRLFLDPARRPKVVDARGNTTNVLLVDGEVAGVWDLQGDTIAVAAFEHAPAMPEMTAATGALLGVLGPKKVVLVRRVPDLDKGGQNAFQAPLTQR